MLDHELELPLPDGLPEGLCEFPLVFPSLPDWLPPTFQWGVGARISAEVNVRVDVDWALDPKARFPVKIIMPPRRGVRSPVIARSPKSFHDSIGFEVTLATSVIRHDEPIEGAIALRGTNASFDAVQIDLVGELSTLIEKHPRERTFRRVAAYAFLPAERLRNGRAVPFSLRHQGLL